MTERNYEAELHAAEQRIEELEQERELLADTVANLQGDLRGAEREIRELRRNVILAREQRDNWREQYLSNAKVEDIFR